MHPFEESGQSRRNLDPCTLVIFGATGDLTARKLLPALYHLKKDGELPTNFACVGFARREKSDESFRTEMKEAVKKFSRTEGVDEAIWAAFASQLFYHSSSFDQDQGYLHLKEKLSQIDAKHRTRGNYIFYLSTQPTFFPLIIQKLHTHGLLYSIKKGQGKEHANEKWSRVIIEKPFGRDFSSAVALQKELMHYLAESQLYRIDHYLGKETVQNLLVFRFANAIFENLWNHRYIDHVQLTVAEHIGIGSRGHFYEEQGVIRDIIQNHMMQLLSLIAMEPPVNLDPQSIQNEKVKVLEAIRPMREKDFDKMAVRGQYGKGWIYGKEVCGYREEKDVSPTSSTETYGAVKLLVDNWRWYQVPFYLRGAKRLPKRTTDIAIVFKNPPDVLFDQAKGKGQERDGANVLTIRIQPNEGIALKIHSKVPGPNSPIQPVTMDFRYGAFFGMTPPDAYERLICDCIANDNTLFARQDEVLHSWRFWTPLLSYWKDRPPLAFPNYAAGSWGPKEADQMIQADGRKWRLL